MALLDQLHIMGIRNFPADKNRVVRFQRPLTLIVGENGCGKTTIIECIKFALTNEYPQGASSGKNFVHDPRIGKKDETHAIVKLQCTCENNDTVCVVRSLLLSNKNGKDNCATRDTTISRKIFATGVQKNLGCLQQESVLEMCNLIGVSKAILNNVIFCHQENSSWPLDEGKKVKEIFDEIFDATKYNKALESIKIQRDRLRKEIPEIKAHYQATLNYKKEADSKKQLIYNNTQKRDQSFEELHNIEESMKPINEKLVQLTEKERNMSVMSTQYQTKKTERDMIQESCNELESSIKQLFSGDKAELQSKLNLFKINLDEKCSELENQERLKSQYIQEEKQSHTHINEAQMKLGKLERDEETHKKLNDTLKTKLNNLADTLCLDTTAKSQYTPEEGEGLIKMSQTTIDKYLSDIKILERTFSDNENTKQAEINALIVEKVELESKIKSFKQQIEGNKKDLTNVITQINEVNQSQSTLQVLQTKLNRVNSEIDQLSKSLDPDQLKNEIEAWIRQRNELEDELCVIDAEISILQAQNITLAEIKSLKNRKESKLADINLLKERHDRAFHLLFDMIPEENFKNSLDKALSSITFDINRIQEDINAKEKHLYTLEANVSNSSKTLRDQKRTLAELMDRMELVLGSKPFEDELDRVTLELKREQEEVSMMTSTQYLFNSYIGKLEENEPRCPLCTRFFESDYSVPGLVNKLKTKIKEIPEQTNNKKTHIDQLCKQQRSLQELKPVYENIMKLQDTDIPSLRSKLVELEVNVIETKGELKKLKTALETPKTKEKTALSLQGDLTLLDQNIRELNTLQRELERQESKISGMRSTGVDLDQVLAQQKEKKNELNTFRSKIESGQPRLNSHNEKLQSLQKQKNDIHSKQLTVQGGAGMLKSLEDRKCELEGMDSVYQTELEELGRKVAPIETQLNLAQSELDALKKEHKKKLNEEGAKIQDYTKQLEEVKRIKQEILNYTKRGTLTQLAALRESVQKLNQRKEDIIAKRGVCERTINEINQSIANQSLEEIDLKNNLTLLEKKEAVAKLNEEVETLKKDIIHLDLKSLRNEREKLLNENETLMKKKANINGRVQEIGEIIKATENDLKKEYLKNADQRFLKNAYKLKLSEIMISDLTKYHHTLENCVIKYHSQKMRSINRLIREYWTRIYQGNDIDYISIAADVGTGSEKRRTYNYRVVQKKNGIEQDMRNRCSAGQRVLACLIIRLALAETFSRNCGIFALDEPTTNLDIKNAVSLSKALALLVEEKSDQKNFQLIVITHDEEFIENLTAIDRAYVVRIVRDHKGLSDIQYPANTVSNDMEENELLDMKMRPNKKMKTRY
ncbi:hypothetical protein M8J77_010773 [Diaphorina citri]|nr:hypothetical protein M8J77_010773 [Diaphorina citri]